MLKIFRTDIYLQAVILVVTVVLLWVRAIIAPVAAIPEGGSEIFYLLTDWMSPRVATVTAMILIVAGGLFFNSLLYRNKMIGQNTLLPMLFFILAMSLGSRQTTLTPLLVGVLFLILCASQTMITGTLLSLSIDKTFGAAASLSLGTLICPSLAVFVLPLMMCMLNYSLYSWRDWTMLMLGIAAPYIPVELYWYLSGDLFYRNYLLLYDLTNVGLVLEHPIAEWVMSLLFFLLTVVAFSYTIANNQRHGTNYKKNTAALLFPFVGSLIIGAYSTFVPLPTQAYALPFAFCCSVMFHDEKKKEWIWNILLIALLLAAVAYNILSNSQYAALTI